MADHPDRKPDPEMLLRALADLPIDPARAAMFGDCAHDAQAGIKAGLGGLVVEPGQLLTAVRSLLARWRD